MVEPTHLKNMIVKMGASSPSRGGSKTYLKPPRSVSSAKHTFCKTVHHVLSHLPSFLWCFMGCQETREMQITRSALPSCPEAMQKPQLNMEDTVLAAKKGCPNSEPLFLCNSKHSYPTSHFGISNKRIGPYPHVFFLGILGRVIP